MATQQQKVATTLGVLGLAGVLIWAISKSAGAAPDVPLWFTASQAQLDQLEGAGMSQSEIKKWRDVAFSRTQKAVGPGEGVCWSGALGYYVCMPTPGI